MPTGVLPQAPQSFTATRKIGHTHLYIYIKYGSSGPLWRRAACIKGFTQTILQENFATIDYELHAHLAEGLEGCCSPLCDLLVAPLAA